MTFARKPRPERKPLPAYSLTRTPDYSPRKETKPQEKQPPHRSRKLLDLAHDVHECQSCGRYVEHGCEPAHANGAKFGKAMGRKADDWAHAAMCHDCHVILDQGPGPYEVKRDMWLAAHIKTTALYWRNGWIGVTKQ